MVYYVIMIKLRLLCTFTILGADNSPKTTILRLRWWHRAKEILLFRFPSTRNSIIVKGHLFWISATKASAALFEYRSRRLNIKQFAVVVYFCLVDCYSCMKCKNVRDWNDREDENSKHISLTSSLRNWNRWQRSLTCHGMEVVVFNSHAFIIVYMHGVRWQWKIETKIVQPLFSVTQAI